ncbi:MAG: glycosyltransferase [Chloroflexi bacterium]|nr:glycosyltransferase [Chloroflexota bacterium]
MSYELGRESWRWYVKSVIPGSLRIAMLSVHSCPLGKLGGRDTGGMNVYVRELALELGRKRHKVDIFTRTHQPEHEELMDLDGNVRLVHLGAGDDDEMPKVALYVHLQGLTCGVENFRAREGLHYDILHSHYWLSGLVGRQLGSGWNVPHVTMFHTMGAAKNRIGLGEDETELRIESEREVALGCDRIIAATERERDELARFSGAAPDRISVVPCGVNPELFQPVDRVLTRSKLGLSEHGKVILYVGRIERLKGLSRLVEALAMLGAAAPFLMIVGGDEHSESEVRSLEDMACKLGVREHMTFCGRVAQEELPAFYSAADACIIPSYYESFGMVALESLACGTPVVATDVGGMRSVVRQDVTGYLVRDNSPSLLSEAIARILSVEEDRAQAIQTRRSLVAGYSWGNIANLILREYQEAFDSYPARVSS